LSICDRNLAGFVVCGSTLEIIVLFRVIKIQNIMQLNRKPLTYAYIGILVVRVMIWILNIRDAHRILGSRDICLSWRHRVHSGVFFGSFFFFFVITRRIPSQHTSWCSKILAFVCYWMDTVFGAKCSPAVKSTQW
jgi:hypothetical protein